MKKYHIFFLKSLMRMVQFYLFIYLFGCIGSLLLCADFLQLQRVGAPLRCGAQASHCGDLLLQSTGSRCAGFSSCITRALKHAGFSSCGTQAQLLHGMWALPRPGIKPVSPTLAGGFLNTAPPGKFGIVLNLCKTLLALGCILIYVALQHV